MNFESLGHMTWKLLKNKVQQWTNFHWLDRYSKWQTKNLVHYRAKREPFQMRPHWSQRGTTTKLCNSNSVWFTVSITMETQSLKHHLFNTEGLHTWLKPVLPVFMVMSLNCLTNNIRRYSTYNYRLFHVDTQWWKCYILMVENRIWHHHGKPWNKLVKFSVLTINEDTLSVNNAHALVNQTHLLESWCETFMLSWMSPDQSGPVLH